MPSIRDTIKHAWNAFTSRDPTKGKRLPTLGYSTYYNSSRDYYVYAGDKNIVNYIYSAIARDCAQTNIRHIYTDDNGRFKSEVKSGLNNCLSIEANKDQTGRELIQDIVESMLSEGYIAVCPIDTDDDIASHDSFDIYTMRVGRVIQTYPDFVQVRLYNDTNGQREDLIFPKKSVALLQNPFYTTMNLPNSTLQRLIRKLALLDAVDEQSGAGKLDLIIQLPYIVKSETRAKQAEARRKQIEEQLANSKYGIAYTDGTEHITQLNRSVDNNLMSQIEYLTSMLYSQLGLTTEILNGTANQEAMTNYYSRVIEPIMATIADEFNRKFLTKTARSRGQKIYVWRDPFKLVPVNQIAEIADKFTRNEILSPNEIRQIIGMKPSDSKEADELRNRNLNQTDGQTPVYADDASGEESGESGDLDLSSLIPT